MSLAGGQVVKSWVIQNKLTGEVIAETRLPKVVKALNTNKYKAVAIGVYLASINNQKS